MGHKHYALIIIVLAVAGGALWWYQIPPAGPVVSEPNGSPPAFESPIVDGYKLYKNFLLKFELRYPEDLTVKEYGAADTSTIVFEDSTGQNGFQVFVVPYKEATVSDERFKMDEPSGVMKEPIQVAIDGVQATAFLSQNTLFGETREVWFIHGGFLYEVTTYKDLDPWLAEIMKTWKFI